MDVQQNAHHVTKKWHTYDVLRFEKETKYCPNCGEKMEAEE